LQNQAKSEINRVRLKRWNFLYTLLLMLDTVSQRLLRPACDKLPFCLALLLTALLPFLAPGQYRLDPLTTDDGLPQNAVWAILQSRDGYLWIATSDGLARFDGLKFTIFNTSNTEGIESNRFTCIYEDEQGVLWIGTEDGGLMIYRNGRFQTLLSAASLPDKLIKGIYKGPDGGVLVFLNSVLIQLPDAGSTDFVVKTLHGKNIVDRPEREVFWYIEGDWLRLLKNGVWKSYQLPEGLAEVHITSVYQDRQGSLWLASRELKLLRIGEGQPEAYDIRSILPPQVAGIKAGVSSISEDNRGGLWLTTSGFGVIHFSNGRFTVYTTAEGLTSNVVRLMYQDREGILWVGTWGHGVSRLSTQTINVHAAQDEQQASNVYPLLEDRAGNLWVGTWSAGLKRFAGGLMTRENESRYLEQQLVTALAEDREARLWIGTFDNLYSLKDGQLREHGREIGLFPQEVRAICQDRSGSMWFGTSAGLSRYSDGKLTRFTTDNGLAGNEVKVILEDRQGSLWIGTYGGLSRFKDGEMTTYTKADGLVSNRVRALYEDREGILWIGTYDGGLSRLKDGRISSFTTAQGLFNNGVFQILEDARGNFWMSCNVGIYRVSRQQLNEVAEGQRAGITSIPYGSSDGLINPECNGGSQPAGVSTRDGRLLFPTQAGVAAINPESLLLNNEMPPVAIEHCLLDRRETAFQDEVQVAPGTNSIEIHYTALSFIKSEHIRFKYRLEGLDGDWTEVGTRRAAYYSYLPPGAYTFRVIAANTDGVWNTVGASLRIRVIPPFHRTWWFLSLAGLSLLAVVASAYGWRIRRLQRAKAAQEEFSRRLIDLQESERKRIAAELHDSVSQSLVIIKNRALLSLSAPDDQARSIEQLEEIDEAADHAIEELKEIAYNLRPFQLDRLGLTKALDSMLIKVAQSHSLRITSNLQDIDGILAAESEINLYRMVQESINNIVRHARATEATVLLRKNERAIEMSISDNGRGFDPAAPGNSEAGGGFGLTSLLERARIIGARAQIESTKGQGTTISIQIPLSR
jgi:signal transduction histidine kinase/ligand-binding sensor domain-containing protein